MMRLFIATPLPKEAEEFLGQVIADLRSWGRDVKWVKPANIHITLRFLGDTDDALVPDLKNLVERVACRQPVITSSIRQLGAFPNLRRPRVFWAGLGENTGSLAKMAAGIEQGVRELGFEAETKRFKPHLTIGRVRRGGDVHRLAETVSSYTMSEFPVSFDRIILFQSTLTPNGPVYRRLHDSPLGQPRFEG